MREVAPGLWDWQSPHPEWEEGALWAREVSSHAYDDGERLLLFDPLDVPAPIRELVAERETAVVLTAPWHERDTQSLVEELGVPVYATLPETGPELIELYDVDPARVEGFVSSDLRWLVHEGGGEFHELPPAPFGLEAFVGRTRCDLVFWLEPVRAVIAGDTLADWGDGIAIHNEWLSAKVSRDEVVARLRPLLAKPVEAVLPAHGTPTDRAALERALA
jgi:hypothetical protein